MGSRVWRAVSITVVVVMVLALVGFVLALRSCDRAFQVESRAREGAFGNLQDNVVGAVACLTTAAPRLDPADGADALADDLTACGYTQFMNKNDDFVLHEASARGENVIFSGTALAGRVVLQIMTTGPGVAQAGVANARAYLVTCWQVTIDLGTDTLEDYTATACNDALVTRYNPSEQVPFDELDLP